MSVETIRKAVDNLNAAMASLKRKKKRYDKRKRALEL